MTVDQLIDNFQEIADIYSDLPLLVELEEREELTRLAREYGAGKLQRAWQAYLQETPQGSLDHFLRVAEERLRLDEDPRPARTSEDIEQQSGHHPEPEPRPTWQEIEKARVEVSIPGMRRISEILRDPRQRAAWATGKQTRALAAERKSN